MKHKKLAKFLSIRILFCAVNYRRSSTRRCYQYLGGIGVARRAKGGMPPRIFRKYSHFVLWEAFLKKNSVIPLKSNILAAHKFLAWLRHCLVVLFG